MSQIGPDILYLKAQLHTARGKENSVVQCKPKTPPAKPHAHARKNQVGEDLEVRGKRWAGFIDNVATLSHPQTLVEGREKECLSQRAAAWSAAQATTAGREGGCGVDEAASPSLDCAQLLCSSFFPK